MKSGSCKRNDGRRWGGEGAAIHALRLAEIYVVDGESSTTVERIIRSRGAKTHDVSEAAADVCTKADLRYLKRRMSRSDPTVSALPLPGIFTDAHAKMMGGVSPLRIAAGYIPTSLRFLSKCRNDVRAETKPRFHAVAGLE